MKRACTVMLTLALVFSMLSAAASATVWHDQEPHPGLKHRYPVDVVNGGLTPDVADGYGLDPSTDVTLLDNAVAGKSMDLSGGEYTINLTSTPNMTVDGSEPITLSGWVYLYSYQEGDGWSALWSFGEERQLMVMGSGEWNGVNCGEDAWGIYTKQSSNPSCEVNFTLPLQEWTHVAYTYHPDEGWRGYRNGELMATSSLTGTIESYPGYGSGFSTGLDSGAELLNGTVDEWRVYQARLTGKEVQQLHEEPTDNVTGETCSDGFLNGNEAQKDCSGKCEACGSKYDDGIRQPFEDKIDCRFDGKFGYPECESGSAREPVDTPPQETPGQQPEESGPRHMAERAVERVRAAFDNVADAAQGAMDWVRNMFRGG